MLSIAFVIAGGRDNFNPFQNPPLCELHLLTLLEEQFGDKVELSMIDLRGIEMKYISYYIPEKDIYMYSLYTPEWVETISALNTIKGLFPKSTHIGGGPHINIFPEECGNMFDSIVLGEGEMSIVNIINDYIDLKVKPIYRQSGDIDINRYSHPLRKYLPKAAVIEKGHLHGEYSDMPGTAVLFSRGCPFKCHFCANLTFGNVRFRTPELIKKEIEYLKKEYQIEALSLKDDNGIPISVKDAEPLLTALGECGIKWRGQSRANGIKPEMVKLAAEAGCKEIGIGLESISKNALKLVHKGLNLDKAREYMDLLQNHGIGVRLHFIIGLPGEPEDVIDQTISFLENVSPVSVLASILCPLPGSAIYKTPEKYGVKILSRDWSKYRVAFGRFEDEDLPKVMEYEEMTPWGKSMPWHQIQKNYDELQTYLRERNFNQ